jgi:hypothetical protein
LCCPLSFDRLRTGSGRERDKVRVESEAIKVKKK